MRRGVTVLRACVHAVALVLSLLLATGGSPAHEARAAERGVASVQERGSPAVGEAEQERAECHSRGAARGTAAPPVPGERAKCPWEPRAHPSAAGHGEGVPETGSAGVPWRRSVGVPVLNQVFRH